MSGVASKRKPSEIWKMLCSFPCRPLVLTKPFYISDSTSYEESKVGNVTL